MHTLLNRAPRAKCTSRNSLCTWPVNILSCVFCHNSPLASHRFQYVFIIHYTSSNPTPQALEIVETPVLPAQILGPAAFEINRLHWPWWCQFSSCQRVGSPSSPPCLKQKGSESRNLKGTKKEKAIYTKAYKTETCIYIYIHIKNAWISICTYSYSLESRERERERWEDFTKQISIIHVQSYMFTNTYLQRTVLRSKFRQLLISFFFGMTPSTLPQMIS